MTKKYSSLALCICSTLAFSPSLSYASFTVSNSQWENNSSLPYSASNPYEIALFSAHNGEDKARLWSQTQSIIGYGLGVAGFLALLPSDFTNWDKSDDRLLEKWYDNVTEGPVWDRDVWYINYIGHPYFGGVYYQVARKSGYRQWDSFLYSALMSTVYWEYGVEAFAEVPSIQDLVVTPVLGWVYGEWAFQQERHIRASGGKVLGSQTLGDTALFLLDPVDSIGRGINQLTGRNLVKAGTGYISYNQQQHRNGKTDNQIALNVSYQLNDPNQRSDRHYRERGYTQLTNDPVTYGIVGITAGASYLNLDPKWGLQNNWAPTMSLGLYFTKQFSSRLNYTRADLKSTTTQQTNTYESYNLDVQYYFNPHGQLRPYVSAGIGESLKDQDRDIKSFQYVGGAGLHYKFHPNWAFQLDWRHHYGTKYSTNDDLFTGQIVYRFGQGEQGL
ncbi:DUF3943 domain-containing protein [Photobacterium damselae subsp. damselae]|uniref:DUF3943 domain-containing protein n=1 Tax=Photobacterium damselae TaxID=38293 RepID=UPI0009C17B09|nr:DUF3943 domain-containing protein [Photobacterium damselae subsp. damselae]MBF7098645.1 DUF3943 domain-containing protein [Photobacterium damselae]QSH58650.1 DUF3943 domain-containing protein [Photobacterium damselae subsp. damselae]